MKSCMSRIAQYIDSITDTPSEYERVCKEVTTFIQDNDYKKLSKKAHATVIDWEQEGMNKDKINNNLVNEWSGK